MEPAEEKKQHKRLSLMDSAFQLFTTQGITKTSIEEISRRAGVAKGTFYLYFKDKYDLHQKLIQHKSEQLFRHALENSGYEQRETPADRILAITDDILSQLQENRRILLFFNRSLSWNAFRRALERTELGDPSLPEKLFGTGVPKETDRQMEIFTILELISSTCHSVILEDDPVDMDTYRPYLHRSIRAIISSFQAA